MQSSNDPTDSSRGKDWVFNALWTSCSPALQGTPSCSINIPMTFLFGDRGMPRRGLFSDRDTGAVQQVELHDVEAMNMRIGERAYSNRGVSDISSSRRMFAFCRKLLLEYSVQSRYADYQLSGGAKEAFVATVTYSDNETEDITLGMFDNLITSTVWRNQVRMLQAFVPKVSLKAGYYKTQAVVRVRSKLDEDGAAAADSLTRALAKYTESVFNATSNPQAADNASMTSSLGSLTQSRSNALTLVVNEMRAIFCLDPDDRIIFLFTEYVHIKFEEPSRQDGRSQKLSDDADVRASVDRIISNLCKIFQQAQREGLPLEESFAHFDKRRSGFVDADMLIDGLARLGMGVTYTLAEGVLEYLAGTGSGILTCGDFSRLLEGPADALFFDESLLSASLAESSATPGAPARKVKKTLRRRVGHPEVGSMDASSASRSTQLPPLGAGPEGSLLQRSTTSLQGAGAAEIYSSTGRLNTYKYGMLGHPMARSEPSSQLPAGSSSLPLPLSAYTVDRTGARPLTELSEGASEGKRRALEEIKQSHRRWLQKKKATDPHFGSQDTASLANTSTTTNNNNDNNNTKDSRSPSRKGSPTRPSTTGKPGSRGSVRRPPGLDLKKIRRAKVEIRDELFDAGGGLVLAYRVLHGDGKSLLFRDKTREKLEVFRYRSILEVRERNLEAFALERSLREELQASSALSDGAASLSRAAMVESTLEPPSPRSSNGEPKIDRWLGFTLLVVPGLFTTLDTLHKYLQPLLVKYPCAHIVLLGLAGAPNTMWPADSQFSPDQQARCMMQLLHHLKVSRQLPLREPMFLMAVGTGSMAVSRFVSEYLPGLPWLQTRLRALCMVNGCFKISKLLKRKCKLLLKSMTTSIPQEVNELILSLSFWDGFYAQRGRSHCITEFWSTRRGLLREDLSKEALYGEGERDNTQYRGVLEMLKGIISRSGDFDHSALLRSSSLPLVVVQSTEDQLLEHQAALLFQADNLPQPRYGVNDLSKLDTGAVYLHWLRAGHEAMQERPTFFLSVVAHLASLYGVHPDAEEEEVLAEDDEDIDVLAYAAQRKKLAEEAAAEQEAALRREEGVRKAEKKRLKAEQKAAREAERAERERLARLAEGAAERAGREREREEQQAQEAAARAKAEEDERLQAEEEEKKKARQAVEKEKRKRLAEERKKREARAARMRELEVLYEMVRCDFEAKAEARELKKMTKEDSRSRHASDYARELEVLSGCPARARARKEEMHGHRREQAVRRVEDQISRKRSEQVMERRRKADQALLQLQEVSVGVDDATAEGQASKSKSKYEVDRSDHDIPRAYTTAMGNLMKDMLYIRQQYIDCLQRQMLIEEKFEVFVKQQESLQHEAGEIRRKIRQTLALKGRALLQATDRGDLEKLRRRLAAKESSYQELSALTQSRQGQLKAANKSVQVLKVLFKQRIEVFRGILGEIAGLDVKFVAEIKKFKVEKEGCGILKSQRHLQMKMYQKRKASLDQELKRIKAIKAEYVDSALVMPGVMQRVEKRIAKVELKKQIAAQAALLRAEREVVEGILVKMLAYSERIDMLTRYGDKMKVVNKTFSDALDNFLKVSVMDIVHSLKNKQQQAEEQHFAEQAQVQDLSYLPPLVRAARAKDPDLRSRHERRFIGLDVILNPGCYEHVTIVEAEQMQFDEDYQWELSAETIERIDKLSPYVNLALPFLRTGKELEAHMILNMFKRNVGDDVLEERDHSNQICSFDMAAARASVGEYTRSLGLLSGAADAKQMAAAEVVVGVLVRESLRNGVRAKHESDDMSEEEREWLQLDKLLSPWVFDEDERRKPGNEEELAAKLYYSALELGHVRRMTKSSREFQYRSKDATRDGNIYDELRWRYEDGEVLFDDGWLCPYSREQLLEINATPRELLQVADAAKAKRLMDKYYVNEEESTTGAARVESMMQIQKLVADIINGEFERKKQRERELLERIAAATGGKKGATFAAAPKKGPESGDEGGRGEREAKESRAVSGKSPAKLSLQERAASAAAEEAARKEGEEEEEERVRAGRIIKRVWGYWDTVHPASAGQNSQEAVFTRAGYDPQWDHPASYGAYEKVLADIFSDTISDMAAASAKTGMSAEDHPNEKNSAWFIVNSVAQLALEDPRRVAGKRVLLPNEELHIPLQVTNASLKMRQSRSHRFSLPDDDDLRVLDITVAVTFSGALPRKWGRLAAALYLLPEEAPEEESEEQKAEGNPYYVPRPKPPPETEDQAAARLAAQSVPVPVGYSPYSMQALNSADCEGRVIIIHKPRSRPIRPGSFQVVIGCASPTIYSLEVSCRTAKAALPIVDAQISRALAMQERLPSCLAELDSLQDSIRMVERKLLVCQKLAKEAETESARCQRYMAVIGDRLDRDEEQMTLYEEERRDLMREIGIYEIEYAQWAAIFASRCRERDDVKEVPARRL